MQESRTSESYRYSHNKKLDQNSCFSVRAPITCSNLLHQVAEGEKGHHSAPGSRLMQRYSSPRG